MAESDARANEARYRAIRALGRGGMGTVELVFDRVRGDEVARKRILHADAESRIRFKREFRAIERLRHDNVVALHELGEDEEGPYFTMEYVEGTPASSFCTERVPQPPMDTIDDATRSSSSSETAPAPPTISGTIAHAVHRTTPVRVIGGADWGRLESVVAQIASALAFLHSHGVIHCDLKPSNVLVRADGIAKVLDFGVIAELLRAPQAGSQPVSGTIEYMAPERLWGETATPAIDVYALGVMLFELATGNRPFVGSAPEIVSQHLHAEAPRLASVRADAPAKLDDLCARMLAKDPKQRPSLDEVTRALAPTSRVREIRRPMAGELVGRSLIQTALRGKADEAARGGSAAVVLAGATGAGKTVLAEWLARAAESEGWLVLRGCGSPSERVAWCGVDGAIDDLAAALANPERSGTAVRLGESLRIAASAFPVLRAFAPAAQRARTRADAIDAIVHVLGELAKAAPILFVVDDVQWADVDAIALVDQLVQVAPARVLFVATMRDDVEETVGIRWAHALAGEALLPVGPLDDEALRTIIARVAPDGDAARIADLAVAAEGRPFLAEIAGRWLAHHASEAPRSLETGIARALEETSPLAHAVLAAMIAAEGWTEVSELARVLESPAGDVDGALAELQEAGLGRRIGSTEPLGAADVYHDVVRIQAGAALGSDAIARAHDAFARRLASIEAPASQPLHTRVRHLVGARRIQEAALLARDAAREAEEQRAYGFAAAMYAIALRDAKGDDAIALMQSRATALEQVGAYLEAAREWNAVALRLKGPEAEDAMLREAAALLGAHAFERGVARLDSVLVARGDRVVARTPLTRLAAGARFKLGPFPGAHPRRAIAKEVRARLEREVTTAHYVAFIDPFAGLDLLHRARRACLAAGGPEVAARCDFIFAYIAGAVSASRDVGLAEKYAASAARLCAGSDDPNLRATAQFTEATFAMRHGNWLHAERSLDASIALFESMGQRGSQTHLFALMKRAELELWRQNVFPLERHLKRLEIASRDGGAGTMRFHLLWMTAFVRAFRADFEGAWAIVSELERTWPKESVQRMPLDGLALFLRASTPYAPDALVRAHRAIASPLRPLRMFLAGIFGSYGALVEARGVRSSDPRASAKRVRTLEAASRDAQPFFNTVGRRALAHLDLHGRKIDRALDHLAVAAREADRLGHVVDAACARFMRGDIVGGSEGESLRSEALASAARAGVSEAFVCGQAK